MLAHRKPFLLFLSSKFMPHLQWLPRAEKALLRTIQRLKALHEIDRAILAAGSPGDIAHAAIANLRPLVPCHFLAAILFDRETKQALLLAVHVNGASDLAPGQRFPLDDFGDFSKLRNDEYELRRELTVTADSRLMPRLLMEGLRSCVQMPLVASGTLIGLLSVGASKRDAFQAEDLEIIREIANQLAIGIQQALTTEQARQHLDDLGILHTAAQRVQRFNSLEQVASGIGEMLSNWLSFDYASVMLVDEQTSNLVPFAAYPRTGDPPQPQVKASVQDIVHVDSGIPAWVVQTGMSARIGDVRADLRYRARDDQIQSLLAVPLRIGNRIIGVIDIESKDLYAYTASHKRLLETVAAQLASAIDKARLLEQVRAGRTQLQVLSKQLLATEEAERRRIARELHDEIGQALSALKMNLLVLQKVSREPDHENRLAGRLVDSAALAEQILHQVRTMSLNLRPSLLDDFGLKAALRWLLDQQSERAGFKAELVTVQLENRLPTGIETLCYRVVQEALTNIVRHAQAHRVHVEIKLQETELDLNIWDDGIGFDVSAARARALQGASLGLLSIEERVLLAGGQLVIDSAPGRTTEIRVRIPIPSLDAATPPIERRAGPRDPS